MSSSLSWHCTRSTSVDSEAVGASRGHTHAYCFLRQLLTLAENFLAGIDRHLAVDGNFDFGQGVRKNSDILPSHVRNPKPKVGFVG